MLGNNVIKVNHKMKMSSNKSIYCKSEDNEFCQKVLFDNGYSWCMGEQEIIDCRGFSNYKYTIFFIDMDGLMSYETGDKIKGIYFRDEFKNEIRELKLKRICKE